MGSHKIHTLTLPAEFEIPNEFYSFTPEENALLIKIGTQVIFSSKKELLELQNDDYINNLKTELRTFHEKELEEHKIKLLLVENDNNNAMKHQEKTFDLVLKEKENMIHFYKESMIRFDTSLSEFKSISQQLQIELNAKNTEIATLKTNLYEKMKEEAVKREELIQKIMDKKAQSTIDIGNRGEFLFQDIANETFRDFPEYESEHVAERGHLGDVWLFFKDFNVLCDTKFHKSKVGKHHREQIKSDLQRNTKFKFAWLVSLETDINKFGQAPFIFESIISENGDKLYICYINNFSNTENKNELLRSVWYACRTLFYDVIEKQNENNELKQLKVFKENTMKSLEHMVRTSREMSDNIKMLQQTKQALDDSIRSMTNNNIVLSIQDEHQEVIKKWWENTIQCSQGINMKTNKIYKQFKKDNSKSEITSTDFKSCIQSFISIDDIIQPKTKGGELEIKNISFILPV